MIVAAGVVLVAVVEAVVFVFMGVVGVGEDVGFDYL